MLLVLTNFFDLCFKDINQSLQINKKKNEIGYKVVIGYPRHFLLEFIKKLISPSCAKQPNYRTGI